MIRIAIVGAGIAGLACADQLARRGIEVRLFDKGKRPGGRLASVAIDDLAWDIGAQSFVVRDPKFAQTAAIWEKAGWVAPWPAGGDETLVGVPTMAALVAAQSVRFDVRFSALVQTIEKDGSDWHVAGPGLRDGPFSAIVVAVPAEQAAALLSLHDLAAAREAAAVRSTPCWAVMTAFAEPLGGHRNMLCDIGPIARAIRTASKPGRRSSECWLLHASADWSRAHLDDAREDIAESLLEHFADALGQPMPARTFAKAHRWRFALPYGQHGAPIWNERLRLGACGDWCIGPTIEEAWLSGDALGQTICETLLTQTDQRA